MGRYSSIGTYKQDKQEWEDILIKRVKEGRVLPIISNVVSNRQVFGSHRYLVEEWANYIQYPLNDQPDLTRLIQFHSVMSKADPDIETDKNYIQETYLRFLQNVLFSIADEKLVDELREDTNFDTLSFSQKAEMLNYPSFADDQQNSLSLLIDLDLPIYLTTSHHEFVERELIAAHKNPHTEVCRWHQGLYHIPSIFETDSNYVPTPQEPLVYHLHGLDKYPESLVLTEDDHLDFLIAISRDMDAAYTHVRGALQSFSLVLLGYSLYDWDFRVIFQGMIKNSTVHERPKSVFIQLLDDQHQRSYLQKYLQHEANFEVYWGKTADFLQEIWQRYQGTT